MRGSYSIQRKAHTRMNTLIIAGLIGVALLAVIGVVALSVGADKTPETTQKKTPTQAPAAPAEVKKELVPVQSRPAVQDDARVAFINGQFYELAAQLHALHQQSQEIERRLSMLSQAADSLKHNQSHSFSIEETENYDLPERLSNAV